jgi:hypothetical protein
MRVFRVEYLLRTGEDSTAWFLRSEETRLSDAEAVLAAEQQRHPTWRHRIVEATVTPEQWRILDESTANRPEMPGAGYVIWMANGSSESVIHFWGKEKAPKSDFMDRLKRQNWRYDSYEPTRHWRVSRNLRQL